VSGKDWKFHCAVLRVREDTGLKDVRRAYRKLALKLHPDKHNGSEKAKEQFQQLNESYRFVTADLIAGHRPSSAPAPNRPSPTAQQPFALKNNARSFPTPPRSSKWVWVHAAAACLALLLLSFFLERYEKTETRAPAERNQRDLSPLAWCFVNQEESGKEAQLVAEQWPQERCNEKCKELAAQKNVLCEWSGETFHRPKGAAKASSMQITAPTLGVCEVEVEPFDGRSGSTISPRDKQSKGSCQAVCAEILKEKTREAIRCRWDGVEFQSRKRAALAQAPEPLREHRAPSPTPPPVQAEQGGFRSFCFMSVVAEEGSFADSFPEETQESCESKCVAEINAHPTGREIKCAFAGRQIITYIPDPIVSYMARDPAGSGIQQGSAFIATCQLEGRVGGAKTYARADANTENQCKHVCETELRKMPKGTEFSCSFQGAMFYRKIAD
jgi:hypothetical protein